MRTEAREIAALGGRGLLQSLTHAGIPEREAAAVRTDKDPLFRLRLVRRGLHAVAVNQVPQRERSLAGLRLRIIYVAAPVALRDAEDTTLEVYVPPRQPRSEEHTSELHSLRH